jgi:RecA-family ATPase
LFLLPKAVDLIHGRQGVELILEKCREIEKVCGRMPELVVIDTLSRALGGGSDTEDMPAFITAVDRIRAGTGAHLATVHHSGHATTKRGRGSSTLPCALDTEVKVAKNKIEVTEQRDMEEYLAASFCLKSIEIGCVDGRRIYSATVDVTPRAASGFDAEDSAEAMKQKIAEMVEKKCSEREIAQATGLSKTTIHRRITQANGTVSG